MDSRMEKLIPMSEADMAILLDLLGKIQTRGLNLIGHAGELKAIRELEAALESESELRYEKDYKAKVEAALEEKWDAGLIKVDFRRLMNAEAMMSFLGESLDFPESYGGTWASFADGLIDACRRDQVILLLNKEKMHPSLIPEVESLKRVVLEFNRDAKHKIEVVD